MFIGLCFTHLVKSQDIKSDSAKCMEFLELAANMPDKAVQYLNRAGPLANTSFLRQRLNREWVYYYASERSFDSALYYVDLNLTPAFINEDNAIIQEEVARSYGAKRSILVSLGRFHECFDPLFKAIEIYERFGLNTVYHSSVLVNVGIDFWRIDDFKASLEWLERAIQFSKKHDFEGSLLRAYITKGLVYKSLNQLSLAEEYYQYVFELIGTNKEQQARDYMISCNNIGIVYMELEEFDSAISYYQKGMALIESGKIEDQFNYLLPFYGSVFQVNMGNIRLKEKDFLQAKRHFSKSIATMQETYGPDHPFQIESIQGISESYLGLEELEKAVGYADDLIRLYRSNDMNAALGYNLKGSIYWAWEGKQDLALSYYDSAILLNPPITVSEEQIVGFPEQYSWSLSGKIKVLLDQDEVDVVQIETLFATAKNLIRQTNQLVPGAEIKKDINEMLDVFYRAYDKIGMRNDLKTMTDQRKWEIIQLSRAAKLKSQLRDQYSMTYSVPDSILVQEKQLKDSLELKISLMKPGVLDTSLFVLKRAYDEFIEQLEKDYPRYAILKKKATLSQIEEKRKALKSGQLMMSFFEGQENLFLLKVTKEGITSKSLNKDSLYQKISSLNEAQ